MVIDNNGMTLHPTRRRLLAGMAATGTLAATVGTPGSKAEGARLATPSTRSRPGLMCGTAEPALGNIISTSPPIKPMTPGPVPL